MTHALPCSLEDGRNVSPLVPGLAVHQEYYPILFICPLHLFNDRVQMVLPPLLALLLVLPRQVLLHHYPVFANLIDYLEEYQVFVFGPEVLTLNVRNYCLGVFENQRVFDDFMEVWVIDFRILNLWLGSLIMVSYIVFGVAWYILSDITCTCNVLYHEDGVDLGFGEWVENLLIDSSAISVMT